MVCLRCGYCCLMYDVVIVDDPEKGIVPGNLVHKSSPERCKHLAGEVPGNFSCAVHGRPWYRETPCHDYGQIERSMDDPCRMGKAILDGEIRAEAYKSMLKNHR